MSSSQPADAAGFAANIERFTGFADTYDRYRPAPPQMLAQVLCRLAGFGAGTPAEAIAGGLRVVDLGCGTGLSTRYWHGKAAQVTGVEPTRAMREAAAALPLSGVRYVEGFSHATGLEAGSAHIVTCSQALHWMEPQATFVEAARILVPGGVFAAFDYDWPPLTGHWQADAAYSRAEARCRELEAQAQLSTGLRQWDKAGHLQRMGQSGVFRWTREILLHHQEQGGAERLVGLFFSQGSVQTLLKAGRSEAELGIDQLRVAAAQTLGTGLSDWLWCSRLRVGVV